MLETLLMITVETRGALLEARESDDRHKKAAADHVSNNACGWFARISPK